MRGNTESHWLNARVEFRAYAAAHRSELVDSERRCPADLISVNHQGARLRLPHRDRPRTWRPGQGLVLNLRIAKAAGATENLPCLVRWMADNDLSVEFARPLDVAVGELQGWLEN